LPTTDRDFYDQKLKNILRQIIIFRV